MKYMTKEWYETVQKTDLNLLLKVSKPEVFSEDYFKELYNREEKKRLNNRFPQFDPERERKNFRQLIRNKIRVLKKKLPEDILEKVADIRVLALDYASAEVKKEITIFCKQNENNVRSALDAYQQYRKQFMTKAPDFAKELNLHDCEVRFCRRKGNDVVLTLDNSGGFTHITRIRMKNCEVITQDSPLHGAWCLYEEIYKTGEKYEIHFLMRKNKLIDYIVSVDDLEYQYE